MKIKDELNKALAARNTAKGHITAAEEMYRISMDSLYNRHAKNEITSGFFDQEKARLKQELAAKQAEALKPLEDIRAEFHAAVDAWALPSGDKLDTNTVWIVQNMDLSADEYNRLLEQYKYNPTTYRVVRASAEARRAAIAEANAGRPINQQIPFDLADPIQTPEARKAEFDTFLLSMQVSLGDHYVTAVDLDNPSAGHFASIADKLSATAARFAERIQPIEDGDDTSAEDFPYKVEDAAEVPKVW